MGYLLGSFWNSRTSSEFRADFENKDIVLHKYNHFLLIYLISNISLKKYQCEKFYLTILVNTGLIHWLSEKFSTTSKIFVTKLSWGSDRARRAE